VLVPPRDNMLLHETTVYVDLDAPKGRGGWEEGRGEWTSHLGYHVGKP
jgi:hypothetical protein